MAILSIGAATYDLFFFMKNYPKENTKSVASSFLESGGGPCGNAAYLLGLWNENVYYLGHISNDTYGPKVIKEFEQARINIDGTINSPEMITPLSVITVNQMSGTRTIISHKLPVLPALTDADKKHIDQFIQQLLLTKSEITVLIDGHEPELSEYVIKQLPANTKVVMDGGSFRESNVHLAQYTDYLVASENFLLGYCGIERFETKAALQEALIKMKQITKGEVLVTLGERGCAYIKNGELQLVPSFVCNIVDTTGAGDIFHGAFVYGIYHHWRIEKVLPFASLASAISIERPGVRGAIPTLEEMQSLDRFPINTKNYFL